MQVFEFIDKNQSEDLFFNFDFDRDTRNQFILQRHVALYIEATKAEQGRFDF